MDLCERNQINMEQFTFTVQDENGIHARPAGMLANCAKGFASRVRVLTPVKEADGKRLLSIMSLGAVRGTEMTFIIEGADEEAAAHALKEFCKEHLGYGQA